MGLSYGNYESALGPLQAPGVIERSPFAFQHDNTIFSAFHRPNEYELDTIGDQFHEDSADVRRRSEPFQHGHSKR